MKNEEKSSWKYLITIIYVPVNILSSFLSILFSLFFAFFMLFVKLKTVARL